MRHNVPRVSPFLRRCIRVAPWPSLYNTRRSLFVQCIGICSQSARILIIGPRIIIYQSDHHASQSRLPETHPVTVHCALSYRGTSHSPSPSRLYLRQLHGPDPHARPGPVSEPRHCDLRAPTSTRCRNRHLLDNSRRKRVSGVRLCLTYNML